MRIYFDNAATTPLHKEVLETMLPYMKNKFGNPSATHAHGRETKSSIETARKRIAELLNCHSSEVIFTSGGTESSNTIINNAVNNLNVERIITSVIEHHCVLNTIENLNEKIEVVFLEVDEKGYINEEALSAELKKTDKKTLVSLIHANNEVGSIIDLKKIAMLCKEYNALFHSDTVQSLGHFNLDLSDIPIDFITGSAHKFHGPKGVGLLFVRKGIRLQGLMQGGGQERGHRAGTENVYGIVGMAKALEMAIQNLESDRKKIIELRAYFVNKLKENIQDVKFNSPLKESFLYTVLNVSFPPHKNGPLALFQLDLEGISASGGSACGSGALKGSHVLKSLRVDPERIHIRFSFSTYNTKEEVDYTIDKLLKIFS